MKEEKGFRYYDLSWNEEKTTINLKLSKRVYDLIIALNSRLHIVENCGDEYVWHNEVDNFGFRPIGQKSLFEIESSDEDFYYFSIPLDFSVKNIKGRDDCEYCSGKNKNEFLYPCFHCMGDDPNGDISSFVEALSLSLSVIFSSGLLMQNIDSLQQIVKFNARMSGGSWVLAGCLGSFVETFKTGLDDIRRAMEKAYKALTGRHKVINLSFQNDILTLNFDDWLTSSLLDKSHRFAFHGLRAVESIVILAGLAAISN